MCVVKMLAQTLVNAAHSRRSVGAAVNQYFYMLHEVFVLEARVNVRVQVLCCLCQVHHPMQLEGAVEVGLPVLQVETLQCIHQCHVSSVAVVVLMHVICEQPREFKSLHSS